MVNKRNWLPYLTSGPIALRHNLSIALPINIKVFLYEYFMRILSKSQPFVLYYLPFSVRFYLLFSLHFLITYFSCSSIFLWLLFVVYLFNLLAFLLYFYYFSLVAFLVAILFLITIFFQEFKGSNCFLLFQHTVQPYINPQKNWKCNNKYQASPKPYPRRIKNCSQQQSQNNNH